jgi:hypothetical protein
MLASRHNGRLLATPLPRLTVQCVPLTAMQRNTQRFYPFVAEHSGVDGFTQTTTARASHAMFSLTNSPRAPQPRRQGDEAHKYNGYPTNAHLDKGVCHDARRHPNTDTANRGI